MQDDTGRPTRLSRGNLWEPLIDNEEAFAALLDAVSRAQRDVRLTQLLFDPGFQAAFPGATSAVAGAPADALSDVHGDGRLAEALRQAAGRGVAVRVALNENVLVPDHVDELDAYLGRLPWTAVRATRRNPGVLHLKLAIVDQEEAFVLGSPFEQKYWDTRLHAAHEARRGERDRTPLHDVSLRLRGPVVDDLLAEFERVWRASIGPRLRRPEEAEVARPAEGPPQRGEEPPQEGDVRDIAGARDAADGSARAEDSAAPPEGREGPPSSAPHAGPHTLQVNVTAPALGEAAFNGHYAGLPVAWVRLLDLFWHWLHPRARKPLLQHPENGILDSHRRALAQARDFAYFENQYFTSLEFARLLHEAMLREPRLQVILVLNEHMDIPRYDGAQIELLKQLRAKHPDRLGLYSLWTTRGARTSDGRRAIRKVYCHSKVGILDDAWASVGSANLDGVSLEGADELDMPDTMNEELNVVLLDGIAGAPSTGGAARLRADLWSELLGMDPEELREPPKGGWLMLWRQVAGQNLRRLMLGESDIQGLVLPYAPALPEDDLRVLS